MMIDTTDRGEVRQDYPTNPLDAPVATSNGPVRVAELWKRYHNSQYGAEAMNQQQYRFAALFGYSRDAMEEDLGLDVRPAEHQMLTGLHLTWLLDADHAHLDLGSNEIGVLMFAGLMHDMGESMHEAVLAKVGAVLGDIPAGRKTNQDRQLEATIRQFLYGELFADVSPEVLTRVEAIIAHQDNTILHEIFEAAHTIQTFDTAMRAGQTLMNLGILLVTDRTRLKTDGHRFLQLSQIYTIVGKYNIPLMRELAEKFSHARFMLHRWQQEVAALEALRDAEPAVA